MQCGKTDKCYSEKINHYKINVAIRFPFFKKPEWVNNELLDIYNSPYRNFSELKMGKFFLYQIIKETNTNTYFTYPNLALFIDYTVIDQTLCYNYIDMIRTWNFNFKNKNDFFSQDDYKISDHVDWGNSFIYIFGIWDKKPNWKELKAAYQKTFSDYGNLERINKINTILKTSIR
jgi:hypothetical protein